LTTCETASDHSGFPPAGEKSLVPHNTLRCCAPDEQGTREAWISSRRMGNAVTP
jgi:hypothetical protein